MIEITGTEGTLSLPDPNMFDGPLRIRTFAETAAGETGDGSPEGWRELPVTGTTAGRGIGVLDMARAIRGGVPHRASGELAQHVLELMATVTDSAEQHGFVGLESSAPAVETLPDDWDPVASTLT
jgi:predicted dehydrogenase